jgi:hypothetical protein
MMTLDNHRLIVTAISAVVLSAAAPSRFPSEQADSSALAKNDPLCCALHNGSYVEHRIMLSQGLRGADEDALTLFGG